MRDILLVIVVLLVVPTALSAQERGEKAKAGGRKPIWPAVPDKAEPRTATFLGGAGSEWLCSGGFQPDGTVVLTGNTLGPVLGLPMAETVVGSDRPAPAAPTFAAKERPSWRHPNATGFIVRMTPDMQKVVSVTRLPWGAAAITATIVDERDGAIYLAGRAGDAIAALGGAQVELQKIPIPPSAGRRGPKPPVCTRHFIAKLSPDGRQVVWLRWRDAGSPCPTLIARKDGIALGSADLMVFDAAGNTVLDIEVPGGVRDTAAVSPLDGTIALGGEYNSPTGREPYRNPVLGIYTPEGKERYQLYNWTGPYVGLDNCRAVSDSAVRMCSFDDRGRLTVVCWSDGGNSVIGSQPKDVRRGIGRRGLGLTAAGANATSFCYLVRLEPKDWEVVGYTMWTSKYAGKPNGIGIDALATASDGSVCVTGGSAWGTIQTPNKLSPEDSEPAGKYVAVFSPDLTRLRFSSVIPGIEVCEVVHDNWSNVIAGNQLGKPKCLLLAGAVAQQEVYEWMSATPVKSPFQATFGGGLCDGYALLIDLPGTEGADAEADAQEESDGAPSPVVRRLTAMNEARSPKDVTPADDVAFTLSPDQPRYFTVDVEIRDVPGRMWPNFMAGKPLAGKLEMKGGSPSGAVTLRCDYIPQAKASQDRRVIGALIADGKGPALTLELTGFGPAERKETTVNDAKGKPQPRVATFSVAKGTLTLGEAKVTVAPQVTWNYRRDRRSGNVSGVQFNAYMTVKGRELGLAALAETDIDLRIGWFANR